MDSLREPAGERIRLLRLIGRLNRGGPTRQALALCRKLPRERFDTLLAFGEVAPGEEEDLEGFFESKCPLERIPSLRRGLNPFRELVAAWNIFRLLRRERPRILHTHLAKAGALGRIVGGLCRVPVRVHTFHGTNFQGHLGPMGTRGSVFLERQLATLSHALIAVSESVRRELLERNIAPPEKIVVIPPGLALESYLAVAGRSGVLRETLKMKEEQPLIGFAGRLVPVKNPLEFVAAAAAVSIARPDSRFVVLGDGPLREAMIRRIEAFDLRDRFFFAGWREDMAACLADLDILASCSRSEGMPLGLIEAMAAGRFVVAQAVGGIPELLGEGRWGGLVREEKGESLEGLILQWLGEAHARQAVAAAAREEVRARYSGDRLAADMAKLYEVLLSGGSPSQFRSSACR